MVSPQNVNPNVSDLSSAKILTSPHIHDRQGRGTQKSNPPNISRQTTCAGRQEAFILTELNQNKPVG